MQNKQSKKKALKIYIGFGGFFIIIELVDVRHRKEILKFVVFFRKIIYLFTYSRYSNIYKSLRFIPSGSVRYFHFFIEYQLFCQILAYPLFKKFQLLEGKLVS